MFPSQCVLDMQSGLFYYHLRTHLYQMDSFPKQNVSGYVSLRMDVVFLFYIFNLCLRTELPNIPVYNLKREERREKRLEEKDRGRGGLKECTNGQKTEQYQSRTLPQIYSSCLENYPISPLSLLPHLGSQPKTHKSGCGKPDPS